MDTYYGEDSSKIIENDKQANGEDKDKSKNDVNAKDENKEKEINYVVHVSGAVKNPDKIYTLKKGSRVYDAIQSAGGSTDEANLELINLAAFIKDGQKIYVPKKSDNYDDIQYLLDDNIKNYSNNGLININSASKIELMSLNGIGEKYAEKIIEYRKKNGKFKTIEDIKKVSCIGDKRFENIKDYITVEN